MTEDNHPAQVDSRQHPQKLQLRRPEQVVLLGTSTRPLAREMHVITCRRWAIPIPVFGTFSPKQTWVATRRRRPFCLKSLAEGP